MLASRPHWTRASVVPAGFLLSLGELANVDLKALGEMIDKRLERSSLRRRIVMAGIDISLNLQDNNIIGWQLHLYMLIEGENTLRLREAIKAAFPPEPTAPTPYDFDEVNDPSNCVTYLFKAIFKRRSRYTTANRQPRTRSLPLKGPELRELLQFLDQHTVGERLILRGIRRNGEAFGHHKQTTESVKMSVICRRELMEIDAKLTEQSRNCSGISEIVDRWRIHSGNGSNTGLSRRNAESRVSSCCFVSVSSE